MDRIHWTCGRLGCLLIALGALISVVAAPAASGAAGELDPSFGNGGIARLFTTDDELFFSDVAIQGDGKIVIVGTDFARGDLVVVRLLENGALDPTFGQGGKVVTTLMGGSLRGRAVAIQPDGKIVVAGVAGPLNPDFLFVRYDTDGTPDPGFGGGDGIETVPVGTEADEANGVAIGTDGRIVATGAAQFPGDEGAGVVVLRPNGEPDPGFADDGSAIVTTPLESDIGLAVSVLGDGRVLIADNNGAGHGEGFTLVRLSASGNFDPSFGGDGIVETPIPIENSSGLSGRVLDMALQSDGKIVASGYGEDRLGTPPVDDGKMVAARYLPNGELDEGFANHGILSLQLAPGEEFATAIEVAPGNKLLLAGEYQVGAEFAPAVLRLQPSGSLDPAFGSGGEVLRGLTAPEGEFVDGAALDSRERLVTVSDSEADHQTTVVVTRYLGDPVPPVAVNQPAHARMRRVPKRVAASKLTGFSGTAADPDGNGLGRVQIALVKTVRGAKAKASAGGLRCSVLTSTKPSFKRVKAKAGHCPQHWLAVKGMAKWRFRLKGELPAGHYVVYARATDSLGLTETTFGRKLRNRYAFRVLPTR
jgi:uncharacterized delta-60 repeat protein